MCSWVSHLTDALTRISLRENSCTMVVKRWMKLMAFEGKVATHCLSLKGVGAAENPGEPRVVLRCSQPRAAGKSFKGEGAKFF